MTNQTVRVPNLKLYEEDLWIKPVSFVICLAGWKAIWTNLCHWITWRQKRVTLNGICNGCLRISLGTPSGPIFGQEDCPKPPSHCASPVGLFWILLCSIVSTHSRPSLAHSKNSLRKPRRCIAVQKTGTPSACARQYVWAPLRCHIQSLSRYQSWT
jgi:hypothetical protein